MSNPDRFDFDFFVDELKEIKKIVTKEHHALYMNDITSLINKTQLFGSHFATLDVRQDSRIHHNVFSGIVQGCIAQSNGIFPNNYNEYVSMYKNTYQHGGVSMQEMFVPFLVMNPK